MDAQKRFLQQRAIAAREMETCCDCPGCETCKGFVRNCKCDQDTESFTLARQNADHSNILRDVQGVLQSVQGREWYQCDHNACVIINDGKCCRLGIDRSQTRVDPGE